MMIRNMVLCRNFLVMPEEDFLVVQEEGFHELFDRMLQVKQGQKQDDEQSGIKY